MINTYLSMVQIYICQIKFRKIFKLLAAFPVDELNYYRALNTSTTEGFNIPFINFDSQLVHNFTMVFSSSLSGTGVDIPTVSTYSLYFNKVIVELAINIFFIARSDLTCSKLSLSLRTSSASLVSEDSILFCILSITAINSCLRSLPRDSSVKNAMYLNNKNNPSYKVKLKAKLFKTIKIDICV